MGDSYQHLTQDPDESFDHPMDYPDDDSLIDASTNGFNYREYRRPADSFKGKVQQKYWKSKQTMIEKLGKQQDEFVVAGDSEVDARLEAFKHIHKTCIDLLRAVEVYQKKIFALSQEENECGRFLREKGSVDKTKAGKMMISVGKSLSYTAQQRLTLRLPLVRLFQEVDTFRVRAIGDTMQTVNRMERLRSEYRAALLWMADISKELDPEAYRKLDKYREVQSEVKVTKKKFEKCKVDVIQKVDLLSASRCNLLSATLVAYQQSLLKFWENTSNSLTNVYEQFRGHPSYQFQMLKHIIPDDSYTRENDIDEEDEKGLDEIKEEHIEEVAHVEGRNKDESADKAEEEGADVLVTNDDDDDTLISLDNLPDHRPPLAEGNEELLGNPQSGKEESSTVLLGPSSASVIQGIDDLLNLSIDAPVNNVGVNMSEFFINNTAPSLNSTEATNGTFKGDLLSGNDLLCSENNYPTTDDLLFGNLSQPQQADNTGDGSSFSETWNKMFGNDQKSESQFPKGEKVESSPTSYMPSDLIDRLADLDPYSQPSITGNPAPVLQATAVLTPTMQDDDLLGASPVAPSAQQTAQGEHKPKPKSSNGNLTSWLNLFSDLDPLSNPDAIGKENQEIDAKRSC